MMAKKNKKQKVVVNGDITLDWNMALFPAPGEEKSESIWWKDTAARIYLQRGGAALLRDLTEEVAQGLNRSQKMNWKVSSAKLPSDYSLPGNRRFHHSHAVWTRSKEKEPAWRVKEFQGLSRKLSPEPEEWQKIKDDPVDAGLVILDDAALGFRNYPQDFWPRSVLQKECPSWILLKMARPVAQGALWEHLHKNCAERVIVVMTVNDLRRTEVQISRELSWERTAQDLFWELTHNPQVNALSRCAHVIISFDTAGALLLSRINSKNAYDATLFFDPAIVEGMWNRDFPGGMIGYTSCLTTGIARQLMLSGDAPDLHKGIQSGLAAMRLLHQKGYTEPGEAEGENGLCFPVKKIAESFAEEAQPFQTASVPRPDRIFTGASVETNQMIQESDWAIIKDLHSDTLDQVARRIVLEGVEEVLDGVPLGKFNKLITVDRREVESFRSIRSLIGEYCGQSNNKPLSIAVFGPPGAGKSFSVKQIAASVQPGEIKELEFNLSQLGSVEDLYDAFHQIRDVSLSGKIPLVFWDEFDTNFNNQPLGWLRYFLAPMQDGSFQKGQLVHPMGRCIFVFAGGTCCRMEEFPSLLSEDKFVEMKGPDFVSRLKGYINILGPNPYVMRDDSADLYFLIRRAIILRVILLKNVPHIFIKEKGIKKLNIDRGVLRALLHISNYKHGVRSLESIISMSSLTGKTSFERSSLPPETQLNLHVSGREFLALAQQLELEGEILEQLAEATHNIFCETKKQDGWVLGPRDDKEKKHPLLKPYAELDETFKESNRVTVRNIPTKLAAAGYVMMPARADDKPLEFPAEDLEIMAELEHNLWLKHKLEQGFTPGKPTPEDPWHNENMIEWEKLSERIKKIDRDLVKDIPKLLFKVGYAVVKLEKGEEN